MADPNHLCRPQLRELVERLAADEGRWRHLVRHAPDRRVYEELLLQEAESPAAVGVWLICWMNDQDTGYHDHDVSSGAVAIARGEVVDERMTLGSRPRARLYSAGQSFDFSASDIHRMAHAGGGPAVSIHAYSPPLRRMGAYVVGPDGVVRRTPVSYEQELRPLPAAAA